MYKAQMLPILFAAGLRTAYGDPYLLRYDAENIYPEDGGWIRSLYDPDNAIERVLFDGKLRIDTTGSTLISDRYSVSSESLIPSSGEVLDVTWRIQTLASNANYGESEVSLTVLNSTLEYASFQVGVDYVAEDRYPLGYPELIRSISPDRPHVYRMISSDLESYQFFVDGILAFAGDFHFQGLGVGPRISWGDPFVGGITSVADWDFVEVSVVPEPSAGILVILIAGNLLRGFRGANA